MTMQKLEIVLLSFAALLALATSQPQGLDQFLTFKNGQVGVNFGGYHAEAGLGGLLTGDKTAGGLHASAGTPSGANAQAGLGGLLNGNGYTGGRLHASAGLGEGSPAAAAGIGGELAGQGSQGGYYAGATSGVGGSAVSKSVEAQSHGVVQAQPSVVGKTIHKEVYHSVPSVQVEKAIDTQFSHPAPSLASSGTVETQVYQSVPTITKTVQTQTLVPAPPVVHVQHVEKIKTRITPKKQKTRVTSVVNTRVNPSVESGVVVEKAVYPAANWNFRKYVQTQVNPAQVQHSNVENSGAASAGAGGFIGGGLTAGYSGGYEGSYQNYGKNYAFKPQPSGQLFDDIFNIPISTLNAVNQLLRNKGK